MDNILVKLTQSILALAFLLASGLGVHCLFSRVPRERVTQRVAYWGTLFIAILSAALAVLYFTATGPVHVDLQPWFRFREYQFDNALLINHLSLAYGLLTSFTMFVIVRFSREYLHRDPGYDRFFLLLMVLQFALLLICYSGNLDTLFIGWELVGIASVLLISFFRANRRASENSLRALTFYRLCDAGMLAASAWMHHFEHSNDFVHFDKVADHPSLHWIAFFLFIASLGKSAQLPTSSWLHRAMEGPTPSSAVFYGALSIHLGPFLLLRTLPLWIDNFPLRTLMFSVGAATALYATFVGKVRGDIKTGLAYRSMAQVAVIFIELSLGFQNLALAHLVAHSLYRTGLFLKSASALAEPQKKAVFWPWLYGILPVRFRESLYIASVNRFYLDDLLAFLVVKPYTRIARIFSNTEEGALRNIFIAQLFLVVCGLFLPGMGPIASYCLLPVSLISFLCMRYLLRSLGPSYNRLTLAMPYKGAAHHYPLIHRYFLIFGLAFIGLPGTIAYIGEDFLFHTLIEISQVGTMLFILITCLNGIAFFRVYSHVFLGQPLNEFPAMRERPDLNWTQMSSLTTILLIGVMSGLFPFLFLRSH